MLDAGYMTNAANFPAISFAGQSNDLREGLYRPILRVMSEGGWLATALLQVMEHFEVTTFLVNNPLCRLCMITRCAVASAKF